MYLLCHRKSRPTGKRLAEALGIKVRFKTPNENDDIAVRWGNPQFLGKSSRLQDARAIAKAGNKQVSFACFRAAGVPCPEITTNYLDLKLSDGEIWFGRKNHGSKGQDIVIHKPGVTWDMVHSSDFYSKYIPNSREYRIHVFQDSILGVMGKYLDVPSDAGDGFIKNHSHGYRFRTPDKVLNSSRHEAAIAAVKALGLDFGAVDLLIGDDGGEYVLEVNTAPALAPLTFAKYVSKFKEVLGE